MTWNVMDSDSDDEQNDASPALMRRAAVNRFVAISYAAVGNCCRGNISVGGRQVSLA